MIQIKLPSKPMPGENTGVINSVSCLTIPGGDRALYRYRNWRLISAVGGFAHSVTRRSTCKQLALTLGDRK